MSRLGYYEARLLASRKETSEPPSTILDIIIDAFATPHKICTTSTQLDGSVKTKVFVRNQPLDATVQPYNNDPRSCVVDSDLGIVISGKTQDISTDAWGGQSAISAWLNVLRDTQLGQSSDIALSQYHASGWEGCWKGVCEGKIPGEGEVEVSVSLHTVIYICDSLESRCRSIRPRSNSVARLVKQVDRPYRQVGKLKADLVPPKGVTEISLGGLLKGLILHTCSSGKLLLESSSPSAEVESGVAQSEQSPSVEIEDRTRIGPCSLTYRCIPRAVHTDIQIVSSEPRNLGSQQECKMQWELGWITTLPETKPHIVSLTVNLDNDTIDTLLHSLWNVEDEPLDLQAGHVDLCKSTPSSEACVLGTNEWAGFASLRCSGHTVGGEEEADMGILPIEFHVRSTAYTPDM